MARWTGDPGKPLNSVKFEDASTSSRYQKRKVAGPMAVLKFSAPFFVAIVVSATPFVAAEAQTKTEPDLFKLSDVVIVGVVKNVSDFDELTNLNINGISRQVHGVRTTFSVVRVVKGKLSSTFVALHHYRVEGRMPSDGYCQTTFTESNFTQNLSRQMPGSLVEFLPNPTNEFELWLRKEGTNAFIPASGQKNAALSVKPISSEWDFEHIHGADPNIRLKLKIFVPAGLSIVRSNGILIIAASQLPPQVIDVTVGTNMNIGMWCDLHVSDLALPNVTNSFHDLYRLLMPPYDVNFRENQSVTLEKYYWRGKNTAPKPSYLAYPLFRKNDNGVPSSHSYQVVLDFTLFETDAANIDGLWSHDDNEYYKVLWKGSRMQAFP